jgi:hypothetical protein
MAASGNDCLQDAKISWKWGTGGGMGRIALQSERRVQRTIKGTKF